MQQQQNPPSDAQRHNWKMTTKARHQAKGKAPTVKERQDFDKMKTWPRTTKESTTPALQLTLRSTEALFASGGGMGVPSADNGQSLASPMTCRKRSCTSLTRHARFNPLRHTPNEKNSQVKKRVRVSHDRNNVYGKSRAADHDQLVSHRKKRRGRTS